MQNKPILPLPEINPLVLELMPHASPEEQKQATQNLRKYIAIVHRIFLRLEAEGKLDTIYDRQAITSEYTDTMNRISSSKIALTICSKRKREDKELLPAQTRYTGAHIEKASRIAEKKELPFFILSGKYGLIPATSKIPYYDKYLEMGEAEDLAKTVKDQILNFGISSIEFFIEDDAMWAPYIETMKKACVLAGTLLSIEQLS